MQSAFAIHRTLVAHEEQEWQDQNHSKSEHEEQVGEMVLPKQRRGRECPRVVKKVPSRYPTRQVSNP